jgi:hypothetical protein
MHAQGHSNNASKAGVGGRKLKQGRSNAVVCVWGGGGGGGRVVRAGTSHKMQRARGGGGGGHTHNSTLCAVRFFPPGVDGAFTATAVDRSIDLKRVSLRPEPVVEATSSEAPLASAGTPLADMDTALLPRFMRRTPP